MDFNELIGNIKAVQDTLQAQAAHAVNLSLTARNWLIGYYIVEFEQCGDDRAEYGEQLLKRIAEQLNRRGMGERRLYEFRLTYITYPQLGSVIADHISTNNEHDFLRLPSAKLQHADKQDDEILRLSSAKSVPQSWHTPAERLFHRLSASHLIYLSNIKDPLKRAFYEQEAILGCWTVKELDRQVSSLYFERMGMSTDKLTLHNQTKLSPDTLSPSNILHDPVSLEFLGLQSQDIYTETKLEAAILNHLQQFLLEMGRGFCFEARQKRILVDQDYFKADLIFYHRILKCHVVVDLKIDRFRHEYASQLNLYLNYYRHEVMQDDDNPPIGILLCTDYGETTVKYATEGLSQNIFVSKYRLQLPSEDEIRDYLIKNIPLRNYESTNNKLSDIQMNG